MKGMTKPIKNPRTVARQWFKNNHPLAKLYDSNGIAWDLHHWDKTLKYTNLDRYNLWIIDDLILIEHSAHMRLHSVGCNNNTYGTTRPQSVKDAVSKANKGHQRTTGCNNGMYGKTGKLNPASRPVICVELNKTFECILQAKKWLGKGDIKNALRTGQKAGGYHWLYI